MAEAYKRLFSPFKLGSHTIKNRVAMAPLTRQMAHPDGTPTDEWWPTMRVAPGAAWV